MSKNPEKIIKEIVDEKTGERVFQIRINLRSHTVSGLRIQRQSSGYKTYAEADKNWTKFYRECLNELVERETKGQSFGAIVDAHELAYRRGEILEKIQKDTFDDRIAILRDWAPDFWNLPAKEVSPHNVLLAMHKMKDAGRSWSRINHFKSAVNRIYTWAMQTGTVKGISQSPSFGVRVKREISKKRIILNEDQIRFLLKSAKQMDHPWYPVWAMALLTGMRSGELFALRWRDVDLEKSMVSVTQSYNAKIKGFKSPKSGQWRTVPINQDLARLLAELRAQTGNQEFVLPRIRGWASCNQAVILKRACIGLGLPAIVFHDLRACFATNLMRKGIAPAQVMKICGWEDLETMERYIRLSGIDIQGATEKIQILPAGEIMAKVVSMSDFK